VKHCPRRAPTGSTSHITAAAIEHFRFQNSFRGAWVVLPASSRTIDAATVRERL
jgi:hypothetical protein